MSSAETPDLSAPCPCGSGLPTKACCGRFIFGGELAPDPERLMRSRFTAYVFREEAYLLETWDAKKRPRRIFGPKDAPVTWKSLEVLGSTVSGKGKRGTVTFRAVGVGDDGPFAMCERSRFELQGGRWRYVDGDLQVEILPELPETADAEAPAR